MISFYTYGHFKTLRIQDYACCCTLTINEYLILMAGLLFAKVFSLFSVDTYKDMG